MEATPTLKAQFYYYDLKMSSANINASTKELKLLEVSFLFLILSFYYLAADSRFLISVSFL